MTIPTRASFLATAFALISIAAVAQVRDAPVQPPRDTAKTNTGTSSISGTVLSDADPPRPVRRATVMLNSPTDDGRTTVTDDAGRFSFTGLPAGRYNMFALKRGWGPRSVYGAKGPGRQGTPIVVAADELAAITIRMPRPAVITGTVLDENGQVPAGVVMWVMQYRYNAGERRLVRSGGMTSGPDDRGQYRIYDLGPGEYYVVASAAPQLFSPGTDLHLTSDVDVQQAANAVEAGPTVPVTNVPQRGAGVSPLYYPGTPSIAQATPVTVRSGEERTGIDFVMQFAATAHIDGTLSGLDGAPAPAGTQVTLVTMDPNAASFGFGAMRQSRTDPAGTFKFSGVAPGSYVVAARTTKPQSWAQAEIDVQGDDIHGVSLALQESLTIAGTVAFAGNGQPPAFTAVSVSLNPVVSPGAVTVSSATFARADASGHFSIPGVTPGRYRLNAGVTNQRGWFVRTSSLGGQESLDTVVDVRSSLSDGLVTLTDQVSELSGHGTPDATVILFSTNPAQWTAPSRRVLLGRVGSDAGFTIKNIPPGEYHIVSVADVEPGQWTDPTYLQTLTSAATKITIAEGEKKTIDLHGGGM